MGVRVVLSLPSKSGPLVINDKINRERGIFEPNMDIRGSVNWQEFKKVYDSVIKINM